MSHEIIKTKICPLPGVWNSLNKAMLKISNAKGLHPPPIPLILAGWNFSNDYEKKRRWEDTVNWANGHDCADLISGLKDYEFYYSHLSKDG